MNRKDRRAEAARQRHAEAMVGMDVRYGGRTLVITTYVNTDEESEELYKRVEPATRGPKHGMVITTVSVLPTEEARGLWEEQDIATFFAGRTLVVTSYINTDESLDHELTQRVMNAANKPSNLKTARECGGQLAVTVTGGEAPLEDARDMWRKFIRKLETQKDGPN